MKTYKESYPRTELISDTDFAHLAELGEIKKRVNRIEPTFNVWRCGPLWEVYCNGEQVFRSTSLAKVVRVARDLLDTPDFRSAL